MTHRRTLLCPAYASRTQPRDGLGYACDPEVIDVDNYLTTAAALDAASIPVEPLDEDDPYFWASSFTDYDLSGPAGDDLGEVEQLILDLSAWEVAYRVVDVGGFLGIDEKQVPIPWSAFGWNAAAEQFTLPLDQDTLEAAPEFNLAEDVVEEGAVGPALVEQAVDAYWGEALSEE